MNVTLVLMFLPLLLLLQATVPVTSRLLSVQVTSYKKSRTTQDGPVRCALDQANKTSSSSSLEDCSLNCTRDGTCTGFNIKNSLTCDHVMTRVLASTSRTRSPVIMWWHLYWLQHKELTHLWSRDDTYTGFNIKTSATCDVYNYKPKITGLVSGCSFYHVKLTVSALLVLPVDCNWNCSMTLTFFLCVDFLPRLIRQLKRDQLETAYVRHGEYDTDSGSGFTSKI